MNSKKSLKPIGLKTIILKTLMILFIVFILSTLALLIILFSYSKNLNYNMPEVVEVEIYDGSEIKIASINNKSRRSYVRYDDISPNIIKAFLTIEDKEYFNHQGVNIKRIIKAMLVDLKENDFSQGASTITQQYVKNTFLTSEKTLKRKIDEALIAIHLESKYTKEEIIEAYLNTIYFDHGLYGINDACLFYFNKSPSEISLNEACIIAAIPKSPSNYSPVKNYEANNERRLLILSELLKDNIITEDEYLSLKSEQSKIHGKLESTTNESAPYFQDIVLNELSKIDLDYSNGIKVYTTLDQNLSKIIDNAINKYYPKNSELQLAIVAMDTSGNVLANLGGVNYLNSTYNRTNSLRQPGSTIKTFLYYAALENGFNVSNTFYSTKTTFNVNGYNYTPSNYNASYPQKDVSMIYAIATSDNIYAVKTHLFLGTNVLKRTLIDFGFTSPITENPSLALGTSEVSLNELTTAYTKIASMGQDVKQTYITKITDFNDKILYEQNYNYQKKFNETTCFLLSEALTSVFDSNIKDNAMATCSSISTLLNKTFAAKSGSTDFDNWLIGYNNNIVLGIWCGYDDNRVMNVSQSKMVKLIWANIMSEYHKNKENSWYQIPDNVIGLKLNPITGQIGSSNEYQKYLYFEVNNLPLLI